MGYSFARPIVADFSICEFAQRGELNADGWGLAWYPDQSLALVKEATRWRSSQHTRFLESYAGIQSAICIAHVRHMTTGRPVHADTHPFARELNGLDYCFAHNGSLPTARGLPLTRFRPIGETDSEHIFCHLLDHIAGWPGGISAPENWPRLHEQISAWNEGGTLNFLLSDGKSLACYHDRGGWKGLHHKQVLIHEESKGRFEDADLRLEMAGQPTNFGVVVATAPLSPRGWESFGKGELIVLSEGAIRYSSHRTTATLEKAS
jgi:glutamine amidotransferase